MLRSNSSCFCITYVITRVLLLAVSVLSSKLANIKHPACAGCTNDLRSYQGQPQVSEKLASFPGLVQLQFHFKQKTTRFSFLLPWFWNTNQITIRVWYFSFSVSDKKIVRGLTRFHFQHFLGDIKHKTDLKQSKQPQGHTCSNFASRQIHTTCLSVSFISGYIPLLILTVSMILSMQLLSSGV